VSELTQQSDRLDRQVWKIVLVAALGSFLAQLDATVVNVSLASLAIDLHSTLPVIQWVTSGYLLALALMLPLNVWLFGLSVHSRFSSFITFHHSANCLDSMLPLSEPNKRGNTSKNWSAMLDALKKMLAWFAAMLTGATFR
jgi:MFS family permease